jgi:hypothetical protein
LGVGLTGVDFGFQHQKTHHIQFVIATVRQKISKNILFFFLANL